MVLLRKDVDDMRKYEEPNMEILLFDSFEVITTSTTPPVLDPDDNAGSESTDWGEF